MPRSASWRPFGAGQLLAIYLYYGVDLASTPTWRDILCEVLSVVLLNALSSHSPAWRDTWG